MSADTEEAANLRAELRLVNEAQRLAEAERDDARAEAASLRAACVGLMNGLEHHPSMTHGEAPCGLCIWMARADAAIQPAKAGA